MSDKFGVSRENILIVGAGPSGLAMAIFLAELGYRPRIIDKKQEISPHSKALGVNPRTLQILERFNITERFLDNGRKMKALNLWQADRHVYRNDFAKVKHSYPFMLVQPQKESEEILLDELRRRKVDVEYGVAFDSFQRLESAYEVSFTPTRPDNQMYDYIVGADGGHSLMRESMDVQMSGFRYDEEWELYDIELETDLNPDEGHIRLFGEGGMIMILLNNDVWRVAGNISGLLNYLPKHTKTGETHWESTFRIHHKVAQSLVKNGCVLIGDAAHLHSPVGARGMNLGIEDAFIASQFMKQSLLYKYEVSRLPYLKKTVNRINAITTGLAGDSATAQLFRKRMNWLSWAFPIVMPRMRKFVMGLN